MEEPCPSTFWPQDYPKFEPRPWLTNGHLQTVVGNLLPRSHHLPVPEIVMVEVAPAHGNQISSQVRCECHWQPHPDRRQRPTVLILHGLEGSSRSQYVLGNSAKFFRAGCNVVRMNMRNCGDTERFTPTLYHSGMSGDVGAVVQFFLQREGLTSLSLMGYSMGGNLVLKYAGELATHAPVELKTVIGISPAMDLALSADALHEPGNRLYERRFVRALLKRFRRKAFLFPRAFDVRRTEGIHSIRDFDERITALYSGFRDADDYYAQSSASRLLDSIRVPTLLVHACDDPFIRVAPTTRAAIAANPEITFLETRHGGHCAFLATPDRTSGNDGYWAEQTALRFALEHTAFPIAPVL